METPYRENFFVLVFVVFFKLGFTPCKAEQPQSGMEIKEKEVQKNEALTEASF